MAGALSPDGGLQPERTALARQRTYLATAVVALGSSLAWVRLGLPLLAAAAAAVFCISAVVGASHGRVRVEPRAWTSLVLLAGAAAVLALLGAGAAAMSVH